MTTAIKTTKIGEHLFKFTMHSKDSISYMDKLTITLGYHLEDTIFLNDQLGLLNHLISISDKPLYYSIKFLLMSSSVHFMNGIYGIPKATAVAVTDNTSNNNNSPKEPISFQEVTYERLRITYNSYIRYIASILGLTKGSIEYKSRIINSCLAWTTYKELVKIRQKRVLKVGYDIIGIDELLEEIALGFLKDSDRILDKQITSLRNKMDNASDFDCTILSASRREDHNSKDNQEQKLAVAIGKRSLIVKEVLKDIPLWSKIDLWETLCKKYNS